MFLKCGLNINTLGDNSEDSGYLPISLMRINEFTGLSWWFPKSRGTQVTIHVTDNFSWGNPWWKRASYFWETPKHPHGNVRTFDTQTWIIHTNHDPNLCSLSLIFWHIPYSSWWWFQIFGGHLGTSETRLLLIFYIFHAKKSSFFPMEIATTGGSILGNLWSQLPWPHRKSQLALGPRTNSPSRALILVSSRVFASSCSA